MEPSSRDLHPQTGARFVFDRDNRTNTKTEPPRYRVTIYLPDRVRWSGQLAWVEGSAQLAPQADPEAEAEADPDPDPEQLRWARAEALKLARVLRRDPKPHMVRWRGSS